MKRILALLLALCLFLPLCAVAEEDGDLLIEEIVETPSGPCYRGHTERYLLLDIPIAATGDTDADPARINTVFTIV